MAGASSQGQDLPRRLSTLDASFLYFERPSQLLHVASIMPLEGQIDYEQLIVDLRGRIALIPRYMERVIPAPFGIAHPTWEPDPEFDVRNHVHHRTLRSPGSDEQLAEMCATLHAQPLNRKQPLWELYLIDGYRGDGMFRVPPGMTRPPTRSTAGDGRDRPPCSVIFSKVHHCMIDGVSGVQLMGILLDASPKAPPPPALGFRQRPALPGFTTRLIDAVSNRVATGASRGLATLSLLVRPRRAVQELQQTADAITHAIRSLVTGAPRTPFNGAIGIGRGLGWITFSLNETKAIKNRLGGSVNDVVLAVISGALRRVLDDRGMNPDRVELRAAIPVNVRGTHEHLKLGNRVSLMVAPLPIGIHDPIERLMQVRDATGIMKNANESEKMKRIMDLLDFMPPPIQQVFGSIRGLGSPVNTICTNVPGPPIALYMQGVRVDRMMPFVPLADGIGLAFAILSYADTMTIGITADAALVPDVREIVHPLHEAFEELWTVTGLERVTERERVLPERQRRNAATTNGGSVTEAPAVG